MGGESPLGAMLPPPGSLPLLLAGPTAAGKTELALLLAERYQGEIISVDSMQVYRALDIGTAKPSPAERARIPHHLIDVVELQDNFDAARFVQLAQTALAQIQQRGRRPILCGGTGLYFKALLEGLGDAPPADPILRAELEKAPLTDLLIELAARDPTTYERIDRQNPRRVIRAVEVIRLTGRPFSEQRAKWAPNPESTPTAALRPEYLCFGLSRSLSDLHRRIDFRVEAMFREGLVAETEALVKRGLAENRTASQALGYRQVLEYLDGVRSLADTIELVKIRTRQFAKRQLTWFRRQLSLTWIPIDADRPVTSIVEQVARTLSTGCP
jgi:tRNA dimethylallyltransferase